MKEKMKELDYLLEKKLLNFGFKRKKKNTFIKDTNGGAYGINLAVTKVKGQEKMHIYVMLTYNYKSLNNLIMYLMDDYRWKEWEPVAINAFNLIQGDNPFGFYLDKNTNLEFVVEDLLDAFEKYGLHVFDEIDTCEKLQAKLYEENTSIINWLVYKKEWYYLALAIMLNNESVNAIVEKNNKIFSSANGSFEDFIDRINNLEKIKEITQ